MRLLTRAQGPAAGTLVGAGTTHYVSSQLPNAPSPFLLPHQPFSNLSVGQKKQEGMFKQTTSPLPEFLVSNIWEGAQDSAFVSSCLGMLGHWAQGPTLGTAVPAHQEHEKTVPLFPSAPPL